MNYSVDSKSVRVDFFKTTPEGAPRKWYCTEAVIMDDYDHPLIHQAFVDALEKHFGDNIRLRGMVAICLDPCHKNTHPICYTIPSYGSLVL